MFPLKAMALLSPMFTLASISAKETVMSVKRKSGKISLVCGSVVALRMSLQATTHIPVNWSALKTPCSKMDRSRMAPSVSNSVAVTGLCGK